MNIPRLKPIDTSVYQRMIKQRKELINSVNEKLFIGKNIRYSALANDIRIIVRDETGVDPMFDTTCRNGRLVQSRQLFLTMMENHTKYNQQTIADFLGKDRCNVISSKKTVQDMNDTNRKFKAMYERIENKIKQL